MLTLLTLANKPDYLTDAVASVRYQTRICNHVVQMDDGSRDWGGRYPPAVFFNEEAAKLPPDAYVGWLSDDDVLAPDFVAVMAGYLDQHPQVMAVYGPSEHILFDRATRQAHRMRVLPRAYRGVFDGEISPYGKLDGGQVVVRRSALDCLVYPWMPERGDATARFCDGAFLQSLASLFGIYPATAEVIMQNRTTPKSAHTQNKNWRYTPVDWRTA
jgi:hypothetical protein